MAEIQWWYAREDEQFGPVSAAELRRLASQGGLSPGDLVWREGMPEWAPAARLKGLFPETPAAQATPREPTPTVRTAAVEKPAAPVAAPAAVSTAVPERAPAVATQETAELPPGAEFAPPGPASDPEFASFTVVEQPPVPPVDIPPPPPAAFPQAASVITAATSAQRPRISHLRLARILALVQGALWGTCVLVILFGGLVFTWARLHAKDITDEAHSATIFSMFFIGAYVVARAGEKISQLILAHVERRRR